MKSIALRLACPAVAFFIVSMAHAGSFVGSLQPYFYYNGFYLNPIGGQRSNRPACATRELLRLVEDPNTMLFRQKYAMLVALWVSGRNITISGSGTCTTEGDEIMSVVVPG